MHPKQVERLAERIRENHEISSNRTKLNKHVVEAHAKLVELLAVRRHLTAQLVRCVEERDNALCEVEHLRAELLKLKTPDAA
jgi:uncharacterized coiled-coil DUF342 family protein